MNVGAGIRFPAVLLAGMFSLLSGCSSTSTPAPVFDRSPGVGAPAPAAPRSGPAVAAPSPAPQGGPIVRAAPIAAAGTPDAAELPPARLDPPTVVKPYREGDWRPEFHVVRKGDTLYSLALDYGEDYRDLAAWNQLEDPAKIRVDQKIRLFPPESAGQTAAPPPAEAAPAPVVLKTGPKAQKLPYSEQALAQLQGTAQATAANADAAPQPTAVPPAAKPPTAAAAPATGTAAVPAPVRSAPAPTGKLVWEWPTQGTLAYTFGKGPNQKGVGIEGKPGQAILAGAPGKVVYSGSGLRGYGKLIIIKHDATYLSVYAHNSQILVKEGQTVAKGQKIAEMGSTDSDRVGLHFEIRRQGKPIDPLPHLPARAS